jgi:hypothetical protein
MENSLKECNNKAVDNHFLSGLFSLPPAQFTLLSTLVGFLFIDGLDLGQQNSLGNFIVGIGQTILVAAAQGQLLQESQDNSPQNSDSSNCALQKQIELLQKQVEALESKMNRR